MNRSAINPHPLSPFYTLILNQLLNFVNNNHYSSMFDVWFSSSIKSHFFISLYTSLLQIHMQFHDAQSRDSRNHSKKDSWTLTRLDKRHLYAAWYWWDRKRHKSYLRLSNHKKEMHPIFIEYISELHSHICSGLLVTC